VFLWRHRFDDLNMRSAWRCSRNDVLSNAGVLVAACAVWLSRSPWPDIVVGAAIASLFGASAIGIVRQALGARRVSIAPAG
jgi:Co/Zn/Cd efflux system component